MFKETGDEMGSRRAVCLSDWRWRDRHTSSTYLCISLFIFSAHATFPSRKSQKGSSIKIKSLVPDSKMNVLQRFPTTTKKNNKNSPGGEKYNSVPLSNWALISHWKSQPLDSFGPLWNYKLYYLSNEIIKKVDMTPFKTAVPYVTT